MVNRKIIMARIYSKVENLKFITEGKVIKGMSTASFTVEFFHIFNSLTKIYEN